MPSREETVLAVTGIWLPPVPEDLGFGSLVFNVAMMNWDLWKFLSRGEPSWGGRDWQCL